MLPVSTRVKYTASALKKYRDDWQSCGREPLKANYKKYYENKCSMRGKIIEHIQYGYKILWDDGTTTETINYYVEWAGVD